MPQSLGNTALASEFNCKHIFGHELETVIGILMDPSLYKLLYSVSPRFDLNVHKRPTEQLSWSPEEYRLGLNVGIWPKRACSGSTETVCELGDSLQA